MRIMKTKIALRPVLLFVFALLALGDNLSGQTTATFNFNNSSDSNYFYQGGGGWAYSSSGGVDGLGGISFVGGTNDIWISKGGFAMQDGNSYTLGIYYKNQYGNGYGGMGFTTQHANGVTTVDDATPLYAIGISAHGGGYFMDNNTSVVATVDGANWYSNAATPTYMGGDLPGIESAPHWLYFTENISFGSGKFTFQMNVYDVNQSTGAIGSLLAQTQSYALTNDSLSGAAAIYPYFSTAGIRFSGADALFISSTAAGVNLVDPSVGAVPEPSTYAAICGALALGFASYKRRRSVSVGKVCVAVSTP